jgi:hypothetical protein
MFREINNTRTEAIIDLIRTLPQAEQTAIVRSLSAVKRKKKLTRKEKNTQEVLRGIAEGLKEIKDAKRKGKELMDLEEALNEL